MKSPLGYFNIDIDKFLREYCPSYIGIYAPDTLPKLQKKKIGCLITNLSNSKTIGTHYVSIIITKNDVIYIDPFGMNAEDERIRNFLQSFDKPVSFNCEQIQSFTSNECGLYAAVMCIYYDKVIIRKVKKYFTLYFTKNLEKNDVLIAKYMDM